MVLKNQADMLCIFHDGSIISFMRNEGDVDFIVDIPYLAELINQRFSQFKVRLKNCTKLESYIWDKECMMIDDVNILDTLDLEILNTEVKENFLKVKCYSDGENFGGDLVIVVDDIIIFDESNQEITPDRIDEIYKLNWGIG